MTRLATLIVALLFAAVPAHAELSPLLGTMNADNATFYPGLLTYPAGGFHAMGAIYGTTGTAATAAGTSEQTLATYSLPANALDTAGRRVRIRVFWHAASNGNNKTVKLYFGSSVITTGVLTSNNKNGMLEMVAVKTGASTQIVTANGYVDTTNITPYLNAGTDTDTAAIVIKMTGTDGTDSAGDIVLEDMQVEYLN